MSSELPLMKVKCAMYDLLAGICLQLLAYILNFCHRIKGPNDGAIVHVCPSSGSYRHLCSRARDSKHASKKSAVDRHIASLYQCKPDGRPSFHVLLLGKGHGGVNN